MSQLSFIQTRDGYISLVGLVDRCKDKALLIQGHVAQLDATALEDTLGVPQALAELRALNFELERCLTWIEVLSEPIS
jgi:hypothetical protein